MNAHADLDAAFEAHLLLPLTSLGLSSDDARAFSRLVYHETGGATVLMALRDYAWVRFEVAHGITLDELALYAVCEAVRTWLVEEPEDTLGLAHEVAATLADAETREALGLSTEEAQAAVAAVKALSPLQVLLVVRAAKQAVSLLSSKEAPSVGAALRMVGLLR